MAGNLLGARPPTNGHPFGREVHSRKFDTRKRAECAFDFLDAPTAMDARDREIGLPQPICDIPACKENLGRAVFWVGLGSMLDHWHATIHRALQGLRQRKPKTTEGTYRLVFSA